MAAKFCAFCLILLRNRFQDFRWLRLVINKKFTVFYFTIIFVVIVVIVVVDDDIC